MKKKYNVVCCECKKIITKNVEGLEADTHGICPKCLPGVQAEIDKLEDIRKIINKDNKGDKNKQD